MLSTLIGGDSGSKDHKIHNINRYIYTVFKNRCLVEKIECRSLDRKGTWGGLKCAITLVITVGMLSTVYSFVQFKIT